MHKSEDLYELLQVSRTAEPEVISAAYRRLAQKYHPDLNESPEAADMMKRLNQAHAVLANPNSRAEYDRQLSNAYPGQQASPTAESRQERTQEHTSPRTPNPDLSVSRSSATSTRQHQAAASPARNMRLGRPLLAIGASLVIILLVGFAWLMLKGNTTSLATDWTFGDSLAIRVKEMRLTEEVRYSYQGKHYVVRPSQEDRTLAAAYVELRTREANVVYLSMNKDSIRLRDKQSLEYRSTDPFQERDEVAEAGPREDTLVPFIWGDVSLPKQCGSTPYCELKGWVLFEVPRGIKFYQLLWDTGNTIYLYF